MSGSGDMADAAQAQRMAAAAAGVAGLRDWYDANGLEWELGPEPLDWFARAQVARAQAQQAGQPATPPRRSTARPAAKPTPPRVSPAAARSDLHADLAAAATLADVRAVMEAFEGCPLRHTAKSLCFYRGAERTPLLVLGEAPGADEDCEGLPFIGRSGQLLDKMLAATGVGANEAHITNVVYWRPPGNRTPTTEEVEACRPFLARQIELVSPRVIMTVGKLASSQILGTTEGIMKLRGRWRSAMFAGREIKVMPALHPTYLLRNPAAKAMAWRDLCAVADALKGE